MTPPTPPPPPRGEMPFLDHLEELRWRILWSLLAIFVCTIVGWWLLGRVDIIEVLKRPVAPYLPGGRLVFTSPPQPLLLTLKGSAGAREKEPPPGGREKKTPETPPPPHPPSPPFL